RIALQAMLNMRRQPIERQPHVHGLKGEPHPQAMAQHGSASSKPISRRSCASSSGPPSPSDRPPCKRISLLALIRPVPPNAADGNDFTAFTAALTGMRVTTGT